MPSLLRWLACCALFASGADGFRKKASIISDSTEDSAKPERFWGVSDGGPKVKSDAKGSHTPAKTMTVMIAGVPVLNYESAYGGKGAKVSASSNELETHVEQDWLVIGKPGTTGEQLKRMCHAIKRGCNFEGSADAGGFPFIKLLGTELDLHAVLSAANGTAKFAEPDQKMFAIPEMTGEVGALAETWGLDRIGRDARSSSGAGVTVFIFDTGVRTSHSEFGGRASSALDMSSGWVSECNGDFGCAQDRNGHGTHCAGSAAGQSSGVAPAATIQAVKVLDDRGSGEFFWILAALDWLKLNAIRPAVASLSLGAEDHIQAAEHAIDAVVDSGVVVVVAAGNNGQDACRFTPAYVPNAITVGSTTRLDTRSFFSNWGDCTTIWAPGSDIQSAGIRGDFDTTYLSGTSMACPHVSGGAALLLAASPFMRPSQVLEALMSSSYTDGLSGLLQGDTNKLLYVGAGSAPPAPLLPAPRHNCPEGSFGPDTYGDCTCNHGRSCFMQGQRGWCPNSQKQPHEEWFFPSCSECQCLMSGAGAPGGSMLCFVAGLLAFALRA